MRTSQPAQIRSVLRDCAVIEIGAAVRRIQHAPSRTHIVLAFAAIYLIWGSTYLGIRYAVETVPPLLMMSVRHLTAGILTYAWARRRGAPRPRAEHWVYATVLGAALFLGGHGILAWAEQEIPSGLAALLCATLPLWTVLLSWILRTEQNMSLKAWAGILLGFAGVALLIGPDGFAQHRTLNLLGAAGAVFSAFLWAVGTLYSKRVRLPDSTALSAAMQMIAGGVLLLLTGIGTGEARSLHLASISIRSALALGYLIVFGSIVAFTAFTWLVTVTTPSLVSTYAYVNPVIAVFLGWALAGEKLGVRILAATVIIVISVILVSTRKEQVISSGVGRHCEPEALCSNRQ
jgi:drug/metabolite transporter (DMT)-like permease